MFHWQGTVTAADDMDMNQAIKPLNPVTERDRLVLKTPILIIKTLKQMHCWPLIEPS